MLWIALSSEKTVIFPQVPMNKDKRISVTSEGLKETSPRLDVQCSYQI